MRFRSPDTLEKKIRQPVVFKEVRLVRQKRVEEELKSLREVRLVRRWRESSEDPP